MEFSLRAAHLFSCSRRQKFNENVQKTSAKQRTQQGKIKAERQAEREAEGREIEGGKRQPVMVHNFQLKHELIGQLRQ